jgi:DNA-binding transcriptional regulator WhiA
MSAYWIGFLMADGNVHSPINKNWQNILALKIQINDIKHIEKFKNFLESEHKITIISSEKIKKQKSNTHLNPQGQVLFSVSSNKLCETLEKYGVVERKSLKEKVSDDLLYNKDFWRGCIDGDGTLYDYEKRKGIKHFYPRVLLNGSIDLILQFKKFCENILNIKGSFFKSGPLYRFSVKGKNAYKLINYLYKDTNISLDRKQKIANIVIKGEKYV